MKAEVFVNRGWRVLGVGQGGGRSECAAAFRAAEERKGVGRATLEPMRGRGSSYLCDDDDVGCLGIGLGAGAWGGGSVV